MAFGVSMPAAKVVHARNRATLAPVEHITTTILYGSTSAHADLAIVGIL